MSSVRCVWAGEGVGVGVLAWRVSGRMSGWLEAGQGTDQGATDWLGFILIIIYLIIVVIIIVLQACF